MATEHDLGRAATLLQQLFGLLIVMTAAAMYYQYDALITLWLSDLVASPAALQ